MTCAGDTVGEHLLAALWNAGESAAWHRRACELRAEADQYLFVPKRHTELTCDAEKAEERSAFRAGLAAGHAFRAAELAYDAGRRDGAHCAARASHDVPVRHAVDAAERQMQIDFAAEWHAQIATLHRGLAEAHVDLSDVDPSVLDIVFPEREDDGS